MYKGQGSRDDRSNYAQPLCALYSVQFLGSISTILVQLWRSSDFLCNLKSGYQRSHYTEMALICLIDQLLTDMDKDHMSGLVFVNWQKAFDLTDRTIILSKLEAYRVPYGIYGAPPTWGLLFWRVGGNQLLLRGCSDKTDQSLMVFPSDQSWVQGPGEQRWQEQLCPTSVRPLLCTIFGKHIHHPCTAMKK